MNFTQRTLAQLLTAVEDRNWDDVEIITAALAIEHGLSLPAALESTMTQAFAEQDA